MSYPAKYSAEIAQAYADSNVDAWTQISFTVPIQASTDYAAEVSNRQGKFLTDVITCKPEDFDATYDAAIADIIAAGADKIVEEQRQAYQDGNYRGTFPGN